LIKSATAKPISGRASPPKTLSTAIRRPVRGERGAVAGWIDCDLRDSGEVPAGSVLSMEPPQSGMLRRYVTSGLCRVVARMSP
jgi:hypothetical protein